MTKSADINVSKFVKLDRDTVSLPLFSDASFASNSDLSSQLGYVVAFADAKGKANNVHCSSVKPKRMTRSVLSSELYVAVHAFDFASTLKTTINDIFGKLVSLTLYTDSKSLYDGLVGINATTEKRLLIDLRMLLESYELRELANAVWISSPHNPADKMTENSPTPALQKLLVENSLDLQGSSWIEREPYGVFA